MNESMAYLSIILCILVGFAHSIPGEKYILIRLFKRNNLPKLFGSDYFTIRTLRFAWHLTTFSWFGFAAILWAIAFKTSLTNEFILNIIGIVFLLNIIFAFAFTKGSYNSPTLARFNFQPEIEYIFFARSCVDALGSRSDQMQLELV